MARVTTVCASGKIAHRRSAWLGGKWPSSSAHSRRTGLRIFQYTRGNEGSARS
jgi:hypothetical protein